MTFTKVAFHFILPVAIFLLYKHRGKSIIISHVLHQIRCSQSSRKPVFFNQYCSFGVKNDSAEDVCYSEKNDLLFRMCQSRDRWGEASREISFPQVRLISHWEFQKGWEYLPDETWTEFLSLPQSPTLCVQIRVFYIYNISVLIAGVSCKYHAIRFRQIKITLSSQRHSKLPCRTSLPAKFYVDTHTG